MVSSVSFQSTVAFQEKLSSENCLWMRPVANVAVSTVPQPPGGIGGKPKASEMKSPNMPFPPSRLQPPIRRVDRKRAVSGTSGYIREDLGGGRILKHKKNKHTKPKK